MIIAHEKDAPAMVMDSPEVKNAAMKVLISPKEGWDDYVMRVVELDEDGYSPKHAHQWPHINYIIEGRGLLYLDGKNKQLETGSYALVPAGTLHQYKNNGGGKFRFICIVPKEGHVV
jgi:quercetin dioxygenase-like cupin family protein